MGEREKEERREGERRKKVGYYIDARIHASDMYNCRQVLITVHVSCVIPMYLGKTLERIAQCPDPCVYRRIGGEHPSVLKG